MKLHEVLPSLEIGHAIRRQHWAPTTYIYIKDRFFHQPPSDHRTVSVVFSIDDVMADNWEVIMRYDTYMTGTHQFSDQHGNVVSPMIRDTQSILDKMDDRNTIYGKLERL